MGDLGDLSHLINGSQVVNLDWLDVDEQEYRAQDRLPQQNLQIGPDLAALWAHEDKPSTTYLEPNQAAVPRTMGDLSEGHGPLRAAPADIVRALRYAMMQTTDAGRIRDALAQRFDSESLRAASAVVAEHLGERGLLGRLYVDAEDFPRCQKGKGLALAQKHACEAIFVKAKVACGDCVHAKASPLGGTNCAQFHKQIVLEVPYTDELADKVVSLQMAKGRAVQASTGNPRERIRLAFLAPSLSTPVPVGQPKPVEATERLLSPVTEVSPVILPMDLTRQKEAAHKAVDEAFHSQRISLQEAQQAFRIISTATTEIDLDRIRLVAGEVQGAAQAVYRGAGEQRLPAKATQAQADAGLAKAADAAIKANADASKLAAARRVAPVNALLRREMLKGRGPKELVTALRLAFDVRDLAETKSLWEPTFHEAGLFGVVYASQESFGDCREGADFLARHNPGVRVMVAGAKCTGCIYNKIGRCLMYGKPLVKSVGEVVTAETVEVVIQEHQAAGRLAHNYALPVQANAANALRTVHAAVEARRTASVQTTDRQNIQTAFRGSSVQAVTSGLTKRAVVEAAQRYLNEGLYGSQLLEAMRARFDPRDLVAAKGDLRVVLAEQGLQGIYYVDPSIYSDYGHGCDEAMRLHRSRLVPAVKVGAKCPSCIHQTQPGFCSKLHKPLVTEPNYVDKAAQQREILASGPATDISYANLINNGHDMVQEFEMGQREAMVEIDAPVKPVDVTVEFGNQGIKL
jgi:hypothetical protein